MSLIILGSLGGNKSCIIIGGLCFESFWCSAAWQATAVVPNSAYSCGLRSVNFKCRSSRSFRHLMELWSATITGKSRISGFISHMICSWANISKFDQVTVVHIIHSSPRKATIVFSSNHPPDVGVSDIGTWLSQHLPSLTLTSYLRAVWQQAIACSSPPDFN